MMAREIMYNSGVHVADRKMLATLAVFYDRIWLPHVGSASVEMAEFVESAPGQWRLDTVEIEGTSFIDADGKSWSIDRFTNDWNERHDALFEADVLCRLPPPPRDRRIALIRELGWPAGSILPELDLILEDIPGLRPSYADGRKAIMVWQDHLLHMLRRDINKPALFLLADQAGRREAAKSVLAESVLSFSLPRLTELTPEEILEVRRVTADNREGFMAHLQGLSGALDKLLKDGADQRELSETAGDVIQTKFVPDFLEFKRQLGSVRVGKAKRILDPASKVLEISSSPWSPKFWYDLVRAAYFTVSGAAENRKEDKTNKALAFNFIRKLEQRNTSPPMV